MRYSTSERRKFHYFYINGKLHKLIRVIFARDEAHAWCYQDHKIRIYQWSDIRRRASRGFTIGEVSRMVNRTTRMIGYYMEWGLINKPEMTYSLTSGNKGRLVFSEEDVFKIREIASNMTEGRPRKDGTPGKPKAIMSKQELYAQLKHNTTLYAKNSDGEFVPLYIAEDW